MTAITIEMPDGYEDYTSPADLPELNVTLIYDLLLWAAHDEANAERFKNWGEWDQGLWARIDTRALRRLGLSHEDAAEVETVRKNGVCGTAYCMAGQAAAQSERRLIMDSDGQASFCVMERPTGMVNARGFTIWEDVPGAPHEDIAEAATAILGLTHDEQSKFFAGSNDLPRLRALANLFMAARGMPLLFPDEEVGPLLRYDEDDEDYD